MKGANRDFLQSPHCAANRLAQVRSSGPGPVVCKSRATHRALITCSMSCYVPRGTKARSGGTGIDARFPRLSHTCDSRIASLVATLPGTRRLRVSGRTGWSGVSCSNPACAGICPGSSHTCNFKIGTPVATLPGAWRCRVSAGTGWPGVSIL